MLSKHIQQRLMTAVEDLLTQLTCSNYSRQTIAGYRYDLSKYICLLDRIPHHIATVKQALSEQRLMDTVSLRYTDNPNIKAHTIRRYVCAYRALIKHLIDQEMLPLNFGRFRFELPKLPQMLPKALPDSLLQFLFSQPETAKAPKNKWLNLRNRCMFELMAFSGLRIGEVLCLHLTDISLSAKQVKVFGKGSVERIVPISESTAGHIGKYLALTTQQVCRNGNYLFVGEHGKKLHHSTVRRALRQHAQRLGITQRITPHSLRHSCATHFMRESKDMRFVQLLLGHRSISTTQVYVHLDNEYLSKTFDQHCLKIDG